MKLCYNFSMKKLLLLCLIFPCIAASSSEITEDYFDIATNYSTYGKYNDAITYLDKILQLEPNNNEAKDLKNTLLRITNPNSKSYLTTKNKNINNSEIAKRQGNYEKEISSLNAVANDFWSVYSLAEVYFNNSDYKNAINTYQRAISLNSDYTQSYLNLAQAYLAIKDYQNAIDALNKYLAYNKNSDIAYALRAKAYLNTNNIDKAENDIKKAINIEEDISYLLIEAEILYYKGDYTQAHEKLNILSKNVQTAEVYKYIGLCDYAMGNYPSALLNTDKAIILSDDDKELSSKYNEIKSKLDKK